MSNERDALATGPTKWRADHCKSHHYACDCREWEFATRVAEFEKEAERWRHARKLLTVDDIEGAQGAFDSFGGLVSEEECLRADEAIDAAMAGANTKAKPTREAGSD